jgi:hypothetical protein
LRPHDLKPDLQTELPRPSKQNTGADWEVMAQPGELAGQEKPGADAIGARLSARRQTGKILRRRIGVRWQQKALTRGL